MGKKEEILELIKRSKEGITTKEIAKELKISEKAVNVYISRDLKNKIESKGIRDRYKLWFVIEQQSNNIMNNRNNNPNNKLTTNQLDQLDKYKIGFKQYNALFGKIMEISKDRKEILLLAKEILDFELLKQLEMIN